MQCLAELPEQGIACSQEEGTSVDAAARRFQRSVLDELPRLVLQTGEAVRQNVAG